MLADHWISALNPNRVEKVNSDLASLAGRFVADSTTIRYGNTVERIHDTANDLSSQLLVLGSSEHSVLSAILTHTEEEVARKSQRPVFVAKGTESVGGRFDRILVGVRSEEDAQMINWAYSLLSETGYIELLFASAQTSLVANGGKEFLAEQSRSAEALGELAEHVGLSGERLRTHVAMEHPAKALAHRADEIKADLVCLGTHPPADGVDKHLGNTAERALRSIDCSVLLVPHL